MVENRVQGFGMQVARGVGEVIEFPFTHPKETVKVIAVGGLAITGTLVTAQVSMLLAEHGGRRRAEVSEASPETEQPDEY
jgi:hypothetical protein